MTRNCSVCGKRYEAQRSTSRYCSDACRQRAHRKRIRDSHAGAKPPQQRQQEQPEREQFIRSLGVTASPLIAQRVIYLLDQAAKMALREMVETGINATAVGNVERSYATFRAHLERELHVARGAAAELVDED